MLNKYICFSFIYIARKECVLRMQHSWLFECDKQPRAGRADGVVVSRLICIQEVPGSIPGPSTFPFVFFCLLLFFLSSIVANINQFKIHFLLIFRLIPHIGCNSLGLNPRLRGLGAPLLGWRGRGGGGPPRFPVPLSVPGRPNRSNNPTENHEG